MLYEEEEAGQILEYLKGATEVEKDSLLERFIRAGLLNVGERHDEMDDILSDFCEYVGSMSE